MSTTLFVRATRLRALAALVALTGALAACASPPPESASLGTVVVGLTSDLLPGVDLVRLHITRSIDGVASPDRTSSVDGDPPLAFPMELPFEDLPDGARIDVRLEAFDSGVSSELPFLTRHLTTTVVAGHELLLRARLAWECVPSFHLPADQVVPTCSEPDTCVAAACVSPEVPSDRLEPYSPTWATAFADECRPLDAGPPELTVGQGIDAFAPLADGDPVAIQAGKQGGFHVWVALRMKNLHRAGAVTTLTGTLAATGEPLCDVSVPWDFAPSTGGYCDLPGVRCIVADNTPTADGLLDQKVHLVAKTVDATGDVGFGEKDITLVAPP
jgi:hypothetical protein